METGPIVRSLLRRKSASALLVLEVAVGMVVLVNNFVIGAFYFDRTFVPSGVDDGNLVFVTRRLGPGPTPATAPAGAAARPDPDAARAQAAADLARLGRVPDVAGAAAVDELPFSETFSFCTVLRAAGDGGRAAAAWPLEASDGVAGAMGLELLRGRAFTPGERGAAIVTSLLARRLVPGGEVLGRRLVAEGLPGLVVVGVARDFRIRAPFAPDNQSVLVVADLPAAAGELRYVVRSAPGRVAAVAGGIREALAPGEVTTRLPALALTRSHRIARGAMVIIAWMTLIVLGVTLAGALAVTSFSVSERTPQIGVRRALGATRGAIVRYFLVENAIATTAGIAIGLAVTLPLNALMVRLELVPAATWWQVALSIALFWSAGLLSALAPALRAARIPPTAATRAL
jgi:putative ABC transport system permease protein